MERRKEFHKDKYRHANFLETLPIREEKVLKLFLKRKQYPLDLR
ncbi:MAG: hypothetical protein ACFE96_07880 [Candidatus Hermodarchaeota archaeon]